MGILGYKLQIGNEASGIVRRVGTGVADLAPGDPVVLLGSGLLRSHAVTRAGTCLKVPSCLSLQEAAGLPVVFATVIYSLVRVGSLKQGQVSAYPTWSINVLLVLRP